MQNIEKLLKLADDRVRYHIENNGDWFTGHQVFIDSIREEMQEAINEIKTDNSVYLEDELWDVFWWIICLLTTFEHEWLIKREKVFERAYNKFSERISYVQWKQQEKSWEEVKKIQKQRRQKEHDDLYNS